MPSEATKASNAGIVTAQTGERHIPESQRADGSTRKAIKIRPGYRPAEDVEVYKNRTAHAFQERQKRVGIPGSQGLKDDSSKAAEASSAASNKNAKRREARKKARATEEEEGPAAGATKTEEQQTTVDPEVEKEKRARNLKKKLKQARDLQNKKEGGETLLPEQIAKVIKINELIRELEALGLDADSERNDKPDTKGEGAEDEATGTRSMALHVQKRVYRKFPIAVMTPEEERQAALNSYRAKLIESREWEAKLKNLRLEIKELQKEFDKTEDNIKALQSVGQIIGEVLKQLDEERFIVKASSGPRYVVGCRSKVDKEKMKQGTRVALDMTTLTIMRMLPREVDPLVYNMSLEDPGQVSFAGIGGLNDQIRELREVIELPLKNPELFLRVGIKPPKGVLLYGPPGTGKTLLARAVASGLETNFLKVVSSAIVDKYIGESARLIREMFGYAKEHEPCIIFMDEIDAIGGRRFSEGTSADREIQRTLMELLNQLDGFDYLGKTKIIMATNRPDTLDPALLRAGRLDRKIEIPLPNEVGRLEILKIHAQSVSVDGDIDFESVVKMSDGLNGADLRNVVTEAGLFAIKDYRESISQDDFNGAVRKVAESKKLEGKLEYQKL
ncbi:uncharacterized protein J7T54_006300 [Emericellopsis cladophorae]|uniref:AAA+ ATPase domain-containing protein n=1 Tax=Emericellopsis cladophorae TaxID=2686198 RepID=A0A9Q0BI80_9HYPO|nr:uncharacterized protein J7T54_006300 [Emericellopsis cladophorae]KAI6785961.1 hypothetical protein J7T54_006300 [Emericellopsis cladophorae]